MFTCVKMDEQSRRGIIVSAMILLNKAHEQLLDDFEEGDENKNKRRRKVPRVVDYCEVTVPSMSDRDFQRSFRLTRSTFTDLVLRLGSKIENWARISVGRQTLSADKQLMIAIQMLANQDPYR